ncbi:MAG: GrpB family protein [Hyphomonadaceae bacterium]
MADEQEARRADATHVSLEPHNPQWMRIAAEESARVAGVLGDLLRTVHHIGSTSIPGIAAKPTVDLMPAIRPDAEIDVCRAPMEALGYLWRGEFGIPGRRYCVLEHAGKRLFHVHIFPDGHSNIVTQLAFRDYLRAHRDEALAYEAIKREAAAAHPADSLKYNDHKSAWIRACQQRAEAWISGRR